METVVLGGGLTGCAVAFLLREKGHRVTIIEKQASPGGLCRTRRLDGINYEFGPHILHAASKETRNFFQRFVEVKEKTFFVRVSLDGELKKLYDFPVSLDSARRLPEFTRIREEIRSLGKGKPRARNFEEEVISRMGKTLYSYFIKKYSAKHWGMDCRLLSSRWGKLKQLSLAGEDKRRFGGVWQGYPEGGYGVLFSRLRRGMELVRGEVVGVKLRRGRVTGVRVTEKGGEERTLKADFYVSTLPPGNVLGEPDLLPYRGICKMFFLLDREHVLPTYLATFPNNYSFTRLTEYKYVSDQKSKNTVLSAAFPFAAGSRGLPFRCWEGEFRGVVKKISGARVVAKRRWLEQYAYPLPTRGAERKFHQVLEKLCQLDNLISLGRLGLYAYVSMDGCVEQARKAVKMLEEYPHLGPSERRSAYERLRKHSIC